MNKIFKIIWNQSIQTWIVVSEFAKGMSKSSSGQKVTEKVEGVSFFRLTLLTSLLTVLLGINSTVLAAVKVETSGNSINVIGTATNTIRANNGIFLGDGNAIGDPNGAGADGSIVLGDNNSIRGNNVIVLGRGIETRNYQNGRLVPTANSILIGNNSSTQGLDTINIGRNARTSSTGDIAIGHNSFATGGGSAAFGKGAKVGGTNQGNAYSATAADADKVSYFPITRDGLALGTNAYVQGGANSAVAIGVNSTVSANAIGSMAIGENSFVLADGIRSIALGSGASVGAFFDFRSSVPSLIVSNTKSGQENVAIGAFSLAYGIQTTALGANSWAIGNSSVAIGGDDSIESLKELIEIDGFATEAQKTQIRNAQNRSQLVNVARGIYENVGEINPFFKERIADKNSAFYTTSSVGDTSVAIGVHSQSGGAGSVAIGLNALTYDTSSTAIGLKAKAGRDNEANKDASSAQAFGNLANASSKDSNAFGRRANAAAESAIAFGTNASVTGAYGVAIGKNANITAENNVAIGSESNEESATNRIGGKGNAVARATINNVTYSGFAGADKLTGVLSVGNKDKTRQIINLAPGAISEDSTDAINGSQLYAVMTTGSWQLQSGGKKVGDVNWGDKVNFTSADKSVTITPTNETGGVSGLDFKVNTDGTTIKVEPNTGVVTANTTELPDANNDGKIDTPTNGGSLVNATTVANAINNSGFTAKAAATADGKDNTVAPVKDIGTVVNPGETVTFEADKNLEVTQTVEANGNTKFSFKTKDDVTFNKVTSNSIEVPTGTTPTDKPITINNNGMDMADKPITNINNGLKNASNGLRDLTNNQVGDKTAATVGDLRNMGWVVSADKTTGALTTAYKDTVKNANEVKFVGSGLATVSGKTDGDVRTITVDVNAQNTVNDAQLPVVYTKEDGTKVVKAADGKFYPADKVNQDGSVQAGATEVPASEVIASLNNGNNSSTAPTSLANVKSNLTPSYNKDSVKIGTDGKPTADTAGTINTSMTAPTAEDVRKMYNNAATVGDVLNAGWNLQENNNAKDFVKAYDTVNFVNGSGTTAKVTMNDNGTVADVTYDVNTTTISQDANTGKAKADSQAGKTGDLFATASNVAEAINKVALKFSGDVKDATAAANTFKRENQDEAKIIGGVKETAKLTDNNIGVVSNGSNTLTVKLAKDITVDSVTTGNTKVDTNGVTIKDPAAPTDATKTVSLTDKGLNNGNNKITNVASGGDVESNGANIGDIKRLINSNGGFLITADKADTGIDKTTGDKVETNGLVKFTDSGANNIVTTVKDNEITFGLNKDVTIGNATDGGSVTLGGNDGVKIVSTPNATAGGKPTNTISNLTGNLAEVDSTTTAQPNANKPADLADKKNNVATVGDVLNAGWNLKGNGTAVDTVVHNDTVDFINGKGTTVTVERDANGKNTIKVDSPIEFVNANTNDTSTPSSTAKLTGTDPVQLGNVASGVRNQDGTPPTGKDRAEAISKATGNALNNAVNVGDLKAATNAAKTEVESVDGSVNIEERQGDNGQTIYDLSVNQSGLKASDDKKTVSATKAGNAFATAEEVANAINTAAAAATTEVTSENGSITVVESTGVNGQNLYDLEVTKATLSYDNNGKVVSDKDGDAFATGKNVADMINNATATAKTEVKGAGFASVTEEKGDNGQTIYTVNVAKADAPTFTDGKVEVKPVDEDKVMSAGDVANAINKSGFTLKTSATEGENLTTGNLKTDGELINPSNTVEMIAGKNLTVKQDADGKVTYATKDDVEFKSIKLGDATNNTTLTSTANGLDVGRDKITNVAAGVEDNDAVNVSQLNQKTAAAKTEVESADSSVNIEERQGDNGQTIYDLSVNQSGLKASDDKKTVSATKAGNVFATAEEVANAINTAAAAATTEVTSENGSITVTESRGDNGQNIYDLEVTKATLSYDNNGKVVSDKDGDAFATGKNVADMINNATATAKTEVKGAGFASVTEEKGDNGQTIYTVNVAKADAPTFTDGKVEVKPVDEDKVMSAGDVANAINKSGFNLKTSANGGEKDTASTADELINPGETVEMVAGKNLTVKQDADGKVTFATKDDVQFNSVQFGGDTGPKITHDGNNIKVGYKDGKASITNVKSNLAPVTVADGEQPSANNPDNLADKLNNAATVADVLNAGWNLQDNGTSVDTVTHNDAVNFVNGRGTTVSVKPNEDGTVNNIQVDSALGYVNNDATDTSTPSDTVKLFGKGEKPVQVTNVASGVRKPDGSTLTAKELAEAIQNATGNTLTNAVNIGDLQAATAAAKTEVVSYDESIKVTESVGDNGQTIYDLAVSVDDTTIETDGNGRLRVKTTTLNPETNAENKPTGKIAAPNAEDAEKLVNAGDIANAINNSGWNLAAEGTNGEELINPSDKVTFKTGSNNLKVKRDGADITYDLARDIDVDTVTAGDTKVDNNGITINNGAAGNPVSLTKNGLNNGGNRITNVAAGRADTDAVNVSQLKGAVNYLDNKINRNNRDLRAGIAGSNAAAGLPQVYIPGKSMVAASAGTFKGEAALAVGYSRASDNGKLILKLQGNTNTRGDVGGSVGIGYQW